MPSLSDRLRNQDDQLLSALMRHSDNNALKQFGQDWIAHPDPWGKQRLSEYLAAGHFPRPHAGLIRELLRVAVEQERTDVMASLFVGVDRSVRRRRIIRGPVDRSGQESHEILQVPRQILRSTISVAMRGWLRRQVDAWFRRLREQDTYEYLRVTCQALVQYTDEDFSTGERILDNYCLLRTCFAESLQLTFGPVHAGVVPGYSLNDLEPSLLFADDWETDDATVPLVSLAANSPAAFVRWWAAVQFAKGSRRLHRIGYETTARLVAQSDENLTPIIRSILEQQAAEFAPAVWHQIFANSAVVHLQVVLDSFEDLHQRNCLSSSFLASVCSQLSEQLAPRTIATLARLLRTNHEPFQSGTHCIPFLKLMLQTAGCSRSRPWLLDQLLRADEGQTTVRQFLAEQLPKLSPSARLDYLAALHRDAQEARTPAAC